MSSRLKAPGWVTVLRDTASLVFAWLIVFKQAGIIFDPPAQLSEPLLWMAGALIGVPGVGQILSARFGGGGESTGMDGQPSDIRGPELPRSRSRSTRRSGGE